ncbi:hypothetical protein GCM10009413_30460 [Tatumella punctata]
MMYRNCQEKTGGGPEKKRVRDREIQSMLTAQTGGVSDRKPGKSVNSQKEATNEVKHIREQG